MSLVIARRSQENLQKKVFYLFFLSGIIRTAHLVLMGYLNIVDYNIKQDTTMMNVLYSLSFLYLLFVFFAWFYLLRNIHYQKTSRKLYITIAPIVITILSLIVIVFYTHVKTQEISLSNSINLLTLLLGLITFFVLILCLCSCKNINFFILTIGFLCGIGAELAFSNRQWVHIYYPSNIIGYLDISASYLWVLSSIFIFRSAKKNLIRWFNPLNSLSTQIALWTVSTGSLIFIFVHTYFISITKNINETLNIIHINISIYTSFLILSSILSVATSYYITQQLRLMTWNLRRYSKTPNINIGYNAPLIREFNILYQYIMRCLKSIIERKKREKILLDAATKAAHDIRSPVSVLDFLGEELHEKLNAEQRKYLHNSIERIEAIADDLLHHHRALSLHEKYAEDKLQPVLLSHLLKETILEKKLEYHNKPITISLSIEHDSYCEFTNIIPDIFRRSLSNLINNAAEAISNEGAINCFLSCKENIVSIAIEDNGSGMSNRQLAAIKKGAIQSTKPKGSGIGLAQAIKAIKKWDGNLSISSKVKYGTTITITLPTTKPPTWFVKQINIAKNTRLVICDDNNNDREQLIRKLSGCTAPITELDTEEKAKAFIQQNRHIDGFYFIDLEFPNSSEFGINLIKKFELQYQSILVSHRYDAALIKTCVENNIKFIPKFLIPFIKINVN